MAPRHRKDHHGQTVQEAASDPSDDVDGHDISNRDSVGVPYPRLASQKQVTDAQGTLTSRPKRQSHKPSRYQEEKPQFEAAPSSSRSRGQGKRPRNSPKGLGAASPLSGSASPPSPFPLPLHGSAHAGGALISKEEAERFQLVKEADQWVPLIFESLDIEASAESGGAGPPQTQGALGTGLNATERVAMLKQKCMSLKLKTVSGYRGQLKRFLWFCRDAAGNELASTWASKTLGTNLSIQATDLTTEGGRAAVVRFLGWVAAGHPGWYELETVKVKKPEAVTSQTIESCSAALQLAYELQCIVKGDFSQNKLRNWNEVSVAVDTHKKTLGARGNLNPSNDLDAQLNVATDTFTRQDLGKMALQLLNSKDANAARLYAMCMFMFSAAARGDDARQLLLCAMCRPVEIDAIGPLQNFIIPIIIQANKTNKTGEADEKGLFRAREALVCPQGAMARYFMERFTLENEQFPDPRDPVAWKSTVLFAGSNPTAQLAYRSHHKGVKELLQLIESGSSAVTHVFRSSGAQYLESQGLSLDKIMRMGQWSQQVLEKVYLLFFTPDMVLAAGGFPGVTDKDYQQYWMPRFTREMPPSLMTKIYPFIFELQERQKELEDSGKKVPSVRAQVADLKLLATVHFQDSLEIVHLGQCFDDKGVCNNRSIKVLLEDAEFQRELAIYSALMDGKVFDKLRPRTNREAIHELSAQVSELRSCIASSHAELLASVQETLRATTSAGYQMRQVDFDLAANVPPTLTGEEIERRMQQQQDVLEKVTAFVKKSGGGVNDASDATFAELLSDAEETDAPLERFISPSKLPLHPARAQLAAAVNLNAAFASAASDGPVDGNNEPLSGMLQQRQQQQPSEDPVVGNNEPLDGMQQQQRQQQRQQQQQQQQQQPSEGPVVGNNEPLDGMQQQQRQQQQDHHHQQQQRQEEEGSVAMPEMLTMPTQAMPEMLPLPAQAPLPIQHQQQAIVPHWQYIQQLQGNQIAPPFLQPSPWQLGFPQQQQQAFGGLGAFPMQSMPPLAAHASTQNPLLMQHLNTAPFANVDASLLSHSLAPRMPTVAGAAPNLTLPLARSLAAGSSVSAASAAPLQSSAVTDAQAQAQAIETLVNTTWQQHQAAIVAAAGNPRPTHRSVPRLSTFQSIEELASWLLKREGNQPSIVDREFRFRDIGLRTPDTSWRPRSEKQRWLEVKKVWNAIEEEKGRSVAHLPGGGMTDVEAARKLDAARVANNMTVATWVKRLDNITRKPRRSAAAEATEDFDSVE